MYKVRTNLLEGYGIIVIRKLLDDPNVTVG